MTLFDNGFFVADKNNHRILMAIVNDDDPPFDVEELNIAVTPPLSFPYGLAADDNNLYISDAENRIIRVPIGGVGNSPLVGEGAVVMTINGLPGGLGDAGGLSLRGSDLFIADPDNDRIVRVPLDGAGDADGDGEVLPINDEGGLNEPVDVLVDGHEMIIADQGSDRIVVFDLDDGDTEAHRLATLIPGGLIDFSIQFSSRGPRV